MSRISGSAPTIPFATPASSAPAVPAGKLEEVKKEDVSVFLEARAHRIDVPQRGFLARMFARGASVPMNEADRGQLLGRTGQLAQEIVAALTGGVDDASEVDRAAAALGKIDQVLALEDPPVLELLPPQTRERLETNLFAPLKALRQQLGELLASVPAKELRAAESEALVTTKHDVKAGEPFALRRAGNVETKGVEVFETATVKVAAFTHKGIGYAPYDEDALSVRVTADRIIAVVADQAGGEDHLSKDGAASEIAVTTWEDQVARGVPGDVALYEANKALGAVNAAEGKRGVTTLSGVTIEGDKARITSAGDSQVLIYSKDGKIKGRSHLDNYGAEKWAKGEQATALRNASSLTNCLGIDGVKAHTAEVKLEPGDVVVLFSDGIGDMNLEAQQRNFNHVTPGNWPEWHTASTEREIGEYIATGGSAEEIARSVVTNAFANVRSGDGKPDNTTCMVLQIK